MTVSIKTVARPPLEAPQSGSLTVVLPFYNEENYIAETLRSFAGQRVKPQRLILVDNASTDGSVEICERFRRENHGFCVDILREMRPGKINALETGFAAVTTSFVAFCDADTLYPPHYFELAIDLIERGGEAHVGAMGLGLSAGPESGAGRFQRFKGAAVGAFLARQCHTGGYGHVFRASVLRDAGGYSRTLWPYMQADHEIVHRMLKHGTCVYHRDLWCLTSARRTDRKRVSWTFFEIIVYHLTPFFLKDWYFYRFLARRFERRGMMNINLRAQPWKEAEQN